MTRRFNLRFALIALAVFLIIGTAFVLRLYRFAPPPVLANTITEPLTQLPPGLQLDEAYNELSALRFLRRPILVPHFAIDQGIAAAHIYFTALVMLFSGPIAEAGRIASMLAGLLSIAAGAWLVRELFRKKYVAAELTALQLIVAAELAITYWFVHMSRFGLELIVVPLLTLIAFALFWRWLHRPSLKLSALAGALLGLSLYSYAAAYAVPIVIALTFLGQWLFSQRADRPPLKQIAAYGLTFALIVLPLILFAIDRPEAFGTHLETTAATSSTNIIDNIGATLASISFKGDTFTSYNLPGRSLLDPLQSILFLAGLVICIRRVRQPEFLFVLIWCSVMLLPAIFSGWTPAFNRMSGAVAGIVLLVSIGAIELYRFFNRHRRGLIGAILIFTSLAYTTARTAYDYFSVWPTTPGLFVSFSTAERVQAEAIAALPADTRAYISPAESDRPMYAYLWQDQPRAKSFNGRKCSVGPLQADRVTVWLINASEDKRTTDRLKALYPQITSQPLWINNGTTIVRQLTLPIGAQADLPTRSIGSMSDLVQLLKATSDQSIERGADFHTTLLWKFNAATQEDWTESVYLLDANQQVLAQDDNQPCGNSYPTFIWRPGEVMIEDHKLSIPADVPSGEYTLAVSFYRLHDGTRLPALDAAGKPIGNALILDRIVIP
jgi:hypothetical protein